MESFISDFAVIAFRYNLSRRNFLFRKLKNKLDFVILQSNTNNTYEKIHSNRSMLDLCIKQLRTNEGFQV